MNIHTMFILTADDNVQNNFTEEVDDENYATNFDTVLKYVDFFVTMPKL